MTNAVQQVVRQICAISEGRSDRSLVGKLIAEPFLKKAIRAKKIHWRQAKFLNQYSRRFLVSFLIQCHFDLIVPNKFTFVEYIV